MRTRGQFQLLIISSFGAYLSTPLKTLEAARRHADKRVNSPRMTPDAKVYVVDTESGLLGPTQGVETKHSRLWSNVAFPIVYEGQRAPAISGES